MTDTYQIKRTRDGYRVVGSDGFKSKLLRTDKRDRQSREYLRQAVSSARRGVGEKRNWRYAVANLTGTAAEATNETTVKTRLDQIVALGMDTVIQAMPLALTNADWTNFLNWCDTRKVRAILKRGSVAIDPDPADLSPERTLLDAVGNHPALYAYWLVEEPFSTPPNFTPAQLRQMYADLKSTHRHVRLSIAWSGQITGSGTHAGKFSSKTADVHNVTIIPFQTSPALELVEGHARLQDAMTVLANKAADEEMFVTCWIHLPDPNTPGLRTPSVGEMETIFLRAWQEFPRQIKTWCWYQWTSNDGSYLSNMAAHQTKAAQIHGQYIKHG